MKPQHPIVHKHISELSQWASMPRKGNRSKRGTRAWRCHHRSHQFGLHIPGTDQGLPNLLNRRCQSGRHQICVINSHCWTHFLYQNSTKSFWRLHQKTRMSSPSFSLNPQLWFQQENKSGAIFFFFGRLSRFMQFSAKSMLGTEPLQRVKLVDFWTQSMTKILDSASSWWPWHDPAATGPLWTEVNRPSGFRKDFISDQHKTSETWEAHPDFRANFSTPKEGCVSNLGATLAGNCESPSKNEKEHHNTWNVQETENLTGGGSRFCVLESI